MTGTRRLQGGDDFKVTVSPKVLNQHTAGSEWAELLKLETTSGAALTVTPDHVIAVDGAFAPAAEALVGAHLSAGRVTKVTRATGAVINPLTAIAAARAS